jgi:hypothetical protein
MILVTEAYEPPDDQRRGELAECREANKSLGVFDEGFSLDAAPHRLRFGDVFGQCAERWPGRICVLANADIRFDESAALLPRIVRRGSLVTLTRWESDATPRMIGHLHDDRFYSGSQDVWAFIGGDLVGIGNTIPLGYVGCDQAIVGEAMRAGVAVVNPALSIKARHVHAVPAPLTGRPCVAGLYGYPELTTLHTTGNCIAHAWPREAKNDRHA